jgi:DNA invertase Pin-like site-specific DNA recombinase
VGRDGLQKLVNAAKSKNKPFDCLLIDDTSRLARDLSDALRTLKILAFHGVTIVSVSQGIDSALGNARPLLAMFGIIDEEHLTGLAKKVHRGQEGRAICGFTTGGRVYGYDNVPIEDLSRTGKYGRPAVLGVKLEVNPEQATHRDQNVPNVRSRLGAGENSGSIEPGRYSGTVWALVTLHDT